MNYKGKLLIAKPILKDNFFARTVILITEHTKENGAFGFILNKKSNKKISELIPDLDCNFPVYIGGPVENDHIFIVHSKPELIKNCIPIFENYYWAGDFQDVKKAINNKEITENEIKFILGYSGWGFNQLDSELENEDWFVYKDEHLDILKYDENLWKNELVKYDKTNIIWVNSTQHPDLN